MTDRLVAAAGLLALLATPALAADDVEALTLRTDGWVTVREPQPPHTTGAHATTDVGCDPTGTTWLGTGTYPCTRFDSTAAIQAVLDGALSTGATVIVPPGTWLVSNLRVGSGQRLLGTNAGVGLAVLRAISDAASVLEVNGGGSAYLHDIEIGGLQIVGPAGPYAVRGSGHGVYIHDCAYDGSSKVYLHDLYIAGMGGRGVYAPQLWSSSLERVQVDLVGDNAIELQGGNTTMLRDCYVHRVAAGKAAYRIYGSATLVGCNGIDGGSGAGADWGVFGQSTASAPPDAADTAARVVLVNCNVEDFLRYGLWFKGGGGLTALGTTFWAAAGATAAAIRFEGQPLRGNLLDAGCQVGLKRGAAWLHGEPFHAPNAPFLAMGDQLGGAFYNTTFGGADALPQLFADPSSGALVANPLQVGAQGGRILRATHKAATWTPGFIPIGGSASFDVTGVPYVSGPAAPYGAYVAQGGFQLATGAPLPPGVVISAVPTAPNTVRVTLGNLSGRRLTVGMGQVSASVWWHY